MPSVGSRRRSIEVREHCARINVHQVKITKGVAQFLFGDFMPKQELTHIAQVQNVLGIALEGPWSVYASIPNVFYEMHNRRHWERVFSGYGNWSSMLASQAVSYTGFDFCVGKSARPGRRSLAVLDSGYTHRPV